jgi:hypothetical protein
MYPVVANYVAHDRALDMAMMASMELSATEFPMKCEASPKDARAEPPGTQGTSAIPS